MIPILYEAKTSDFTGNGTGFLKDATECTVKEVRNGTFELTLKYPENGVYADKLIEDAIIKAKPNNKDNDQLFRIYKSGKTIAGVNTFYAEHISYELNSNPICQPVIEGKNPQQAIEQVLSQAAVPNNYTAWSDIQTRNSTSVDDVVSVRKMLGGVEGSILDTWGGEYQFDNFTIKLWKNRGKDTGETIRYGKNLITAEQEKNIANTVTAIFPYAHYKKDETSEEEILVKLSEGIIKTPNADRYARLKCEPIDFSDKFEDGIVITEDMLRKVATSYAQSGIDEPSISIKASFQDMNKIKGNENLATFNSIDLCDTVTVIIEKLGINVKAKVVSYTYNVLKERAESVEIGETRTNLTKQITAESKEQADRIIKTATFSEKLEASLKQRIADATAAITGNSGGYVVLYPPENPQEIFVMDTPDTKTAKNVWRWNKAGLGHSSNGVNGPFNVAIQQDGTIIADFIGAGELDGMLIKAGTIKAESLSVEYKQSVTKQIDDANNLITKDYNSKFNTTKKSISAEVERATRAEQTISGNLEALSKASEEFQNTTEGAFRDGIIDEAETQAIERHIYELARDYSSIQSQYLKVKSFASQNKGSGQNTAIKFNALCATETNSSGTPYDYVKIYYRKSGKIYDATNKRMSGADLAGKELIIPSKDIYISWQSDSSRCDYYGFSIDSVSLTNSSASLTGVETSLPSGSIIETTSASVIQTPHPYENNMSKLWHLRTDVITQADLETSYANYSEAYQTLTKTIRNAIADKKAAPEEINDINEKFNTYNEALADLKEAISAANIDIAIVAASQVADYASASFKVTAESIESKVSKNDEGSYITQYYDKVLAQFNKDSRIIQIKPGEIGVYNGAVDDTGKRCILNQNGTNFYRDGNYIGKIGTNSWNGHDDHKGLVFDLEAKAKYMTWACRMNENDESYTTILTYSRANSIYDEEGIHVGTNMYMHGQIINSADLRDVRVDNYTTIKNKKVPIIVDITDNGDGTITWKKRYIYVREGAITAVPNEAEDI